MSESCVVVQQLNSNQIRNVLRADEYCSLVTCNNNIVEISPYLYSYKYSNGKMKIYLDIFSSSKEYENIIANPIVSIEFNNKTVDSDSMNILNFDTVIVNGEARIIKNENIILNIRNKIKNRTSLNRAGISCRIENKDTVIIEVLVKEIKADRKSITR